MSDLKLISILVFILLNFLLSIAHPLDGNEEFQELSAPEISTVSFQSLSDVFRFRERETFNLGNFLRVWLVEVNLLEMQF